MITITDLHKAFGTQQVLRGVQLTVERGRMLVVLGRSGSGKSVLLKCLVGLLAPDRGSITIDGEEVVGLPPARLNALRRRMGYVFQHAALYDSMTVAENLAFHLDRQSALPAAERQRIILEKLRFVGMAEAWNKYPAELSGGMQKRVGLARALVLSPEIVLYDEPITGLDPMTAAEIDELAIRLNRETGVTSIAITHSLESARRTADVIAVLDGGRIVATGTFHELCDSTHPFVKQYFAHARMG
ncbi:MAG: ABC transporter ATP-binding protein [candidate division KSB1 bacterium]|nr:ABC transporter ATP-binding protein [candidate division KSB1 bacterium]MDZ7276340.1 ABC transporter ATP-binding protein [candidate division KSB1 bacterium]MDZ7287707.1 ABC transporter ATP-binding protein [candidate division KSB1 bacterium]MDZ7299953.1 ABC transporter ATP-binding protein [candidate division KSB1 bacterium]MDZ7305718.1 ABC transporter ATP-binding protein [candidate division KSB1 bacterium]